jgi:hypothetical protein
MLCDAEQVTLSLHPAECQQLLDMLAAHDAGTTTGTADASLGSVAEKLADALELARWLRDFVSVDFAAREARELEHLLASVESASDVRRNSLNVCQSVGRKLQREVGCLP